MRKQDWNQQLRLVPSRGGTKQKINQEFVDTKQKKKHVFQRNIIREILQDFCTHSITPTHSRSQLSKSIVFFSTAHTERKKNSFPIFPTHTHTLNHNRASAILKRLERGSTRPQKQKEKLRATGAFCFRCVCCL